MNKKTIWGGVIIIVAIVIIAILNNQPKDVSGIKVGVITSLTGWPAFWGEDAKRGIDLAVEEINGDGGVDGKSIEIIFEDFGPIDLKLAASAANKLVNIDKVNVLLTTFLEDTTVASPIAHKGNTPIISLGAGNKGINQTELLFRIRPYTEAVFPEFSAKYFLEKGNNKPVVFYEQFQYYQNYKDEVVSAWEKIEGQTPAVMAIPTDPRTMIAEAKSKGYDLMYVIASVPTQVKVLKTAKEMGVTIPAVGSGEFDPALISAGNITEGLYFYDYKADDSVNFVASFENKYKQQPGSPAQWGYDAIYALANAIESEGLSTKDIIDGMRGLKFEGASGLVQLDKDQNRIIDNSRVQVSQKINGKFVPINN